MQQRFTRRRALALGAAAAGLPTFARAASAAAPAAVRAGGVPEDSATPALWAIRSGLFRRNGIDFQMEAQRSGSAVAAAVAGGSYQIGKSSITSLILAHARGIPFVFIAPGGLYEAANPVVAMLVRPDSPLRTPADLNGKTIAVSALNDLYTIGTMLWIDKNGGDSSTIKLVELPISAVADAIATGRVDAASSIHPELQYALDSGKVKVFAHPFDAVAPRFFYTAWFTTADYAAKHPEVVTGFARAMRDAATYTNTHHQQTVELIADYTKIDARTVAHMARVNCGTALDPALIQPQIDAAARYKVIAARFDARDVIAPGLRPA